MEFQGAVAYKVVLIGDSFVGKTCLVTRRCKGTFDLANEQTIGARFDPISQVVSDGSVVSLQIWDTAGQEKYRSLGPIYYRQANCGIFVFDLTDRRTFVGLEEWIKVFRETAGPSVPIVIVGNKNDREDACVDCSEAEDFAKQYDAPFFETSAKNGSNVEFMFQKVADMAHKASTAVCRKRPPESDTERSSCC